MPAANTETEGNRLSKSLDRREQRNRYSPWPWIMQWRSVQRGLLLFKVNLSEEGWVWGFNSLFKLVNDRDRKSFDWYAEWPKFPWYFFWLIRACFGQKGLLCHNFDQNGRHWVFQGWNKLIAERNMIVVITVSAKISNLTSMVFWLQPKGKSPFGHTLH